MLALKSVCQPSKSKVCVDFGAKSSDDIGDSFGFERHQVRQAFRMASEIILFILQNSLPKAWAGDDNLVNEYFQVKWGDNDYFEDIKRIESKFNKIYLGLTNHKLSASFVDYHGKAGKVNAFVIPWRTSESSLLRNVEIFLQGEKFPDHIFLSRGKTDKDGNFFGFNLYNQACVIIHELTHLYADTKDIAYSWQNVRLKKSKNNNKNLEEYKGDDWLDMNKEQRLNNADSYEEFAFAAYFCTVNTFKKGKLR